MEEEKKPYKSIFGDDASSSLSEIRALEAVLSLDEKRRVHGLPSVLGAFTEPSKLLEDLTWVETKDELLKKVDEVSEEEALSEFFGIKDPGDRAMPDEVVIKGLTTADSLILPSGDGPTFSVTSSPVLVDDIHDPLSGKLVDLSGGGITYTGSAYGDVVSRLDKVDARLDALFTLFEALVRKMR